MTDSSNASKARNPLLIIFREYCDLSVNWYCYTVGLWIAFNNRSVSPSFFLASESADNPHSLVWSSKLLKIYQRRNWKKYVVMSFIHSISSNNNCWMDHFLAVKPTLIDWVHFSRYISDIYNFIWKWNNFTNVRKSFKYFQSLKISF